MKFLSLIFGFLILALIGGFVYIASVDIPIEREQVRQEIPADKFQNKAQTP